MYSGIIMGFRKLISHDNIIQDFQAHCSSKTKLLMVLMLVILPEPTKWLKEIHSLVSQLLKPIS